MAMKRTQLEKLRAVAILDRIRHNMAPGRFGQQSSQFMNRKERREAEKAAGLVPFAVKLKGSLVERVRELAGQRAGDINGVVAELLEAGLLKYPELAPKAAVAQAPVSPAVSQPVTLAQKLVAVALGQPGATVVEKPVVKPVKPVRPPKPVEAKPAKAVKPAKTQPRAKAPAATLPVRKKAAKPAVAMKKSAPAVKAASTRKPAAHAKKTVGRKKSVAAPKPASRKLAKTAKKVAGKHVTKPAGKAKRKN